MSFRDLLVRPGTRTKLWALMLALGVFASLPVPASDKSSPQNILLSLMWAFGALLTWSVWFAPAYVMFAWTFSWMMGLLWGWRALDWGPGILYSMWGLWFRLRRSREDLGRVLSFVLVSGVLLSGSLEAEPLPKYLDSNRLNQIVSCGSVNDIPWKFRPDSRKARLLVRDRLRLNTEKEFSIWEIHQVMDRDGTVTFVFSKLSNEKRSESIVIKDHVYNHVAHEKGRNRVMDIQDLRTLINRPVLVFYHEDGSSLSFAPGLAGKSSLTIELSKTIRPLAPILIKGNYCERLDDDSESASTSPVRAAAEAAGATSVKSGTNP